MARKTVTTRLKGFTLSELLIALAILGVIATFTIPKVLQGQQTSAYKAIAKESLGIVSGAYESLKLKSTPNGTTNGLHLTPYLNYVREDISMQIDAFQNDAVGQSCDAANPCYILHNGAVLQYSAGTFSGTGTTNAIMFYLDPDGKVTDGTTNGPGKSLKTVLYFNGRIATRETLSPGTVFNGSSYNPIAGADPPWFSWN